MESSATQTIKALVDSGDLSSLPSLYASRRHDPDHLDPVVDDENVPIIDFSLLSSEDLHLRRRAAENLGKACMDWGFFIVVNHGIDEIIREGMLEACKQFFDMSEEEKREFAGTDVSDPIRYGTSFNASIEDVRFWKDYLKLVMHPEFNSPSKPPCFRERATEYGAKVRELTMGLFRGMWEDLGLDEEYMAKMLGLASCFEFFVVNLYPPCPQPEHAMGFPPHTDHGLLAIIMDNGVHGFQVKHDGKWVRIEPPPNSFLVNVGDQLEIVTNGRYKSVLHRAEVNKKNTRMSIAIDILPSLTAVVAPSPPLLKDEPAAYRAITCEEYFEMRQRSKINFPYLEGLKL